MTGDELLTKKDLEDFKKELFELLAPMAGKPAQSKWLRNNEVKKLLGVSGGTLQNLRVNGTLPFNKIGGLYYYKQEDVERMLDGPEKKSPARK